MWNNVEDMPAYDFIPVKNDRDLSSDLEIKWSPFTGEPGINIDIDPDASALQYFLSLAMKTAHIANETNRYQLQGQATRVQKPHSRLNMWYDTTTEEIKIFFRVITLMGLIFNPSQYWSTDELPRTPAFGRVFFLKRGKGPGAFQKGKYRCVLLKNSACLHFISTLQCHLPLLLALKPIHYLMIVNLT